MADWVIAELRHERQHIMEARTCADEPANRKRLERLFYAHVNPSTGTMDEAQFCRCIGELLAHKAAAQLTGIAEDVVTQLVCGRFSPAADPATILALQRLFQFVSPRTEMFLQDFEGGLKRITAAAQREANTHGSWRQERHLQHELVECVGGGTDAADEIKALLQLLDFWQHLSVALAKAQRKLIRKSDSEAHRQAVDHLTDQIATAEARRIADHQQVSTGWSEYQPQSAVVEQLQGRVLQLLEALHEPAAPLKRAPAPLAAPSSAALQGWGPSNSQALAQLACHTVHLPYGHSLAAVWTALGGAPGSARDRRPRPVTPLRILVARSIVPGMRWCDSDVLELQYEFEDARRVLRSAWARVQLRDPSTCWSHGVEVTHWGTDTASRVPLEVSLHRRVSSIFHGMQCAQLPCGVLLQQAVDAFDASEHSLESQCFSDVREPWGGFQLSRLLLLADAAPDGTVQLEQWMELFEKRLQPYLASSSAAVDLMLSRLEACTKASIQQGVAQHGPPEELVPWEQLHYNVCVGGLSGLEPPPHQYREVVRVAPDYKQHANENTWQPGRYFPSALGRHTSGMTSGGVRENQALFLQR